MKNNWNYFKTVSRTIELYGMLLEQQLHFQIIFEINMPGSHSYHYVGTPIYGLVGDLRLNISQTGCI